MSKIYLAGAFFVLQDRLTVMEIARRLRLEGNEVYVPMEHQIEGAWTLSNYEWSAEVFKADITAIQDCDCVYAVVSGMTADAGTCWEVGYAYGINKPVCLVIQNPDAIQSLMLVQSAESITHFHIDLHEIKAKNLEES